MYVVSTLVNVTLILRLVAFMVFCDFCGFFFFSCIHTSLKNSAKLYI